MRNVVVLPAPLSPVEILDEIDGFDGQPVARH
jgi:hypothetical protein